MNVSAIHFGKSDDVQYNLDRLLALNCQASEHGAQLVVNPELSIWPQVFFCQEAMVLAKQGQEIAAIFREQIAARYLNCIVLGLVEVASDCDALFNSAAIITSEGIVRTYRKRFVTDDAFYACRGNTDFRATRISSGHIGALVCADYSLPLISRCLALNGSDIIAIPASLSGKTVDTLQARAMENAIAFVFANSWQQENSIRAQSAIVSANGQLVACSDDLDDQVLFANLQDSPLIIDSLPRRPELYHNALLDIHPMLKYSGKEDLPIVVYTISGPLAAECVSDGLLTKLVRAQTNKPVIFVLPQLDISLNRLEALASLATNETIVVCSGICDGYREISLFSGSAPLQYRKAHLLAGELFSLGENIEAFFESPFGKISILFGHELLLPEVVEAHICQGVDLILVCSHLHFDASPLYRDIAKSRHVHLAVAEKHFYGGVFSRNQDCKQKQSWIDEGVIYPLQGRCELPYLKYGMDVLLKKGKK